MKSRMMRRALIAAVCYSTVGYSAGARVFAERGFGSMRYYPSTVPAVDGERILGRLASHAVTYADFPSVGMRVHYVQTVPQGTVLYNSYGDCQYVELPGDDGVLGTEDDRNLLIDAGKSADANCPVVEYLREELKTDIPGEYKPLHFMLLTHPHIDHFRGLEPVLDAFDVYYFCEGQNPLSQQDTNYSRPVVAKLDAEGCGPNSPPGRYFQLKAGDIVSGPGCNVHPESYPLGFDPRVEGMVLAAMSGTYGENESSVVMHLRNGRNAFLCGGDATSALTELAILNGSYGSFPGARDYLPSVDIFKVHHHGSNNSNSPAFLIQASPQYAVVQVGYGSGGHPYGRALTRFYENQAPIYRNDLDGTVLVKCDGAGNYDIVRERVYVDEATTPGASGALKDSPPEVPPNLRVVEVTENSVLLDWDEVSSSEVHYDVYRSLMHNGDPAAGMDLSPGSDEATGIYEKITVAGITASEYTDNSVEAGTAYYYRVSARSLCQENVDGEVYSVCYERRYSNEASAFLPGAVSSPEIFWVATDGDDSNPGTEAEPWRTIGRAFVRLGADPLVQGGDTVVVKPGTYAEKVDFGGLNITLRSTDPDDPAVVASTIINPRSLDEEVQGSAVTIDDGEGPGAVLSGFTIAGGISETGGGVYIGNGSRPRVEKNAIIDNHATGRGTGGSGICIDNASPEIVGNLVENNTSAYSNNAGGIMVRNGSAPLIERNTIRRNRTVTGAAGGVFVMGGSAPRIVNCMIVENNISNWRASGSGIACQDSAPEIANNTIARNHGNNGAGIYLRRCRTGRVVNNIVALNKDSDEAGHGNPLGAIRVAESDDVLLDYNCVNGNEGGDYVGCTAGPHDLSADPQFVDADFEDGNSNYSLLGDSPCIDAGTAEGAPAVDFEGDARPSGSGVDIGADEFLLEAPKPIVSGAVRDGETSSAIAGATVTVKFADEETFMTTSGPGGLYGFQICDTHPPGAVIFSAEYPGYRTGYANASWSCSAVIEGLDIALYPDRSAASGIDLGDYDGDGTSDPAVFRSASGLWSAPGITRAYFGGPGDFAVPADYDGDGTTEIAVFRGSYGLWSVKDLTRFYLGTEGDLPAPGDYDGDGTAEGGIFREAEGFWVVRGVTRTVFGSAGDIPAPGYYAGDPRKDIAIFRPSTGMWSVAGLTRFFFGSSGDDPVPGDYDGAGCWSAGVFRPSASMWSIRNVTRIYLGSADDRALPADYDGNGVDDAGIFRASSGLWSVRNLTRVSFGSSGDVPATR